MSNEDEGDEDQASNIGVGRYPCMPSLVALQQMRNRLHLANLGKKLMKWSALATGRELRKIAQDLTDAYGDFKNEIADAYILLARCRYFYPNLNEMVLEDLQKEASIGITTSLKPISAGVRCIAFEITETKEPYPHLGIDKGGQTIKDTKRAWANLLKKMILLLQLRVSFDAVDTAHKNASKKQNVLSKIIIPKITRTIKYIMDELEEMEREDNFRLKTFKRSKIRKEKEKMGGDALCTCCLHMFDSDKAMMPELMLCDVCSKVKKLKIVVPKKPVICKNITEEMVQYLDDHLDEIKEWAAMSNTKNVLMKPCCIFEGNPSSSKVKPAPDKLDISFMDKGLVETCECPAELTKCYEACLDSCTKPCNVHCSCGEPNKEKEEIIEPVCMPEDNKNAPVQEKPPKDPCQLEVPPKTIPSSGPCGIETCIALPLPSPQKVVDNPCQTESPVCKPYEEPKVEPTPKPSPCKVPKVEPIPEPTPVKPCISKREIQPPCVPCQSKASVVKPCEVTQKPIEPKIKPVAPCSSLKCIAEPLPPKLVGSPCQTESAVCKPSEEPKVEPIPVATPIKPCLSKPKVPSQFVCPSKASVSKPCEVTQKPIEPKIKPSAGPCGSLTCIEAPSSPPPKVVDVSCQTETSVPDSKIKPIRKPSRAIKPCIIEPGMPPPCVTPCKSKISMPPTCAPCQSKASLPKLAVLGPCGSLSCILDQAERQQPEATKTFKETPQPKELEITSTPKVSCNPCIADLEIPPPEIESKDIPVSESCGLKICTKASSSKPCDVIQKPKIKPITEIPVPKLDEVCITCPSHDSDKIDQDVTYVIDKCKEITTQTSELQPCSNVQNATEQANMHSGGYVEKIIEITKTKNTDGTIQIEKRITIRSKNIRLKSRETLSKTVSEYDDQNITIDSNSTFTDQSRSRICSSCMPSGDIYVLCSCSQSEQSEIDEDKKKVTEKDDQINKEPTKTNKIDTIKSDLNAPCCQMYDPKMRSCISDHVFESKTMKIAKDQMNAVDKCDDNSSETVASATASKSNEKGKK